MTCSSTAHPDETVTVPREVVQQAARLIDGMSLPLDMQAWRQELLRELRRAPPVAAESDAIARRLADALGDAAHFVHNKHSGSTITGFTRASPASFADCDWWACVYRRVLLAEYEGRAEK